jgi:hypothetical protein
MKPIHIALLLPIFVARLGIAADAVVKPVPSQIREGESK